MDFDVEPVERVSTFHRMTYYRFYWQNFVLVWCFLMIASFACFILLYDQGANSIEHNANEISESLQTFTKPDNDKYKECKLAHENIEHEKLRRTLFDGITELRHSVDGHSLEVKNLLRKSDNLEENALIIRSIENLNIQIKFILKDLHLLSEIDNAEKYRRNELEKLSNLVQNRILTLQNPKNCSITVPKIVCNMSKNCGFACQLHHVTYCFMLAFASNRTFLIDSKKWSYSKKGWESVFRRVSETCSIKNDLRKSYTVLPIIDEFREDNLRNYLPQYVPTELSEKLFLLHSNPPVWWIGQFVRYLMRYQNKMDEEIEITKNEINFTTPIVGVHIRRTDKIGTEAGYHSVEEYMRHVEDWYQVTVMKKSHDRVPVKKSIYLATDDPSVYEEIHKKYPDYHILTSPLSAPSAQLDKRYSESSLMQIIQDIHFLSRSSYIVCTFSSQVCRLAYELMQSVWPGDAGHRFKSLDDIYYFGGQNPSYEKVILDHQPRRTVKEIMSKSTEPVNNDEFSVNLDDVSTKHEENTKLQPKISLKTEDQELELFYGDLIIPLGNHWNGYSKGTNIRTLKTGLYPTYKVKTQFRLVNIGVLNNL